MAMDVTLALALLATAVDPGPPVTEVVPVRVDGNDSSWPPVLVLCVLIVVLGGLFAAVVVPPPRPGIDPFRAEAPR